MPKTVSARNQLDRANAPLIEARRSAPAFARGA
jgi:hypothetical protein